MARVLVLLSTTTYKAEAFLAAAEQLGLDVVVGTNKAQVLSGLHPAGNLTLPFHAPLQACRLIAAYADKHPLSGVVAADDEGLVLAAHAAQVLGLPHSSIESVLDARNKLRMRQVIARAGLLVPRFWQFSSLDDPEQIAGLVEYPCVVKPTCLSGSRGVIRADDPVEFQSAFHRLQGILEATRRALDEPDAPQPVLVERFIPGIEVALEGLLCRGRFRSLALFDKPDPLDGPFFQETIYVTPSRHPSDQQDVAVRTTERAIEALGLFHGPIHAELRLNREGAWLLELAPRSIGGLCGRALRFGASAQIALEDLLLQNALDRNTESIGREPDASGVMMIPIPRPGILRQIRGLQEARAVASVTDVRVTIPLGGRVQPPPEGSRYLGFIFARAQSPDAVENALRTSHARLELEIDEDSELSASETLSATDTTQASERSW